MKLKHESDMPVAKLAQLAGRQRGHIGAADYHRPGVGLVERADNLQQCGLACTAGAHDTQYLALADVQVYAFKHLKRAETLGDAFDVYHIYTLLM